MSFRTHRRAGGTTGRAPWRVSRDVESARTPSVMDVDPTDGIEQASEITVLARRTLRHDERLALWVRPPTPTPTPDVETPA